jgi:hypothetical protein
MQRKDVVHYVEDMLSRMLQRVCDSNLILYPLLWIETDYQLDDYDEDFAKFLKRYFPKEIKNKQVDLQNAAGEEKFGIYYSPDSGNHQCGVM